jgi:hypothetical protein
MTDTATAPAVARIFPVSTGDGAVAGTIRAASAA